MTDQERDDAPPVKTVSDAEFRAMLERASTLTPEEVRAQRYQEFLDDFQAGCL